MAQTTLIYGESDTYKSSNAGEAADYIYSMTGGVTRLVSADSGWGPMADQIRRNVIVPWNLTSAKFPLPCLKKIARGFWPTKLSDNGLADESSLRLTQPEDWGLPSSPRDGAYRIGGYIIEGLTMISGLLLSDLTNKQRSTGEPLIGVFDELGETFASSSRGSYNFVQKTMMAFALDLKGLGCWKVIVTGHEGRGSDTAKRPTYGPQLAGQAANDRVTSWFENTLHHESYMMRFRRGNKEVLAPGVRAFYQRHQDPEIPTVFWPAKIGAEPRVKAKIISVYPEGWFPLIMDDAGVYKEGLHTFMRLLDEEEMRAQEGVVQTDATNQDTTDGANQGDDIPLAQDLAEETAIADQVSDSDVSDQSVSDVSESSVSEEQQTTDEQQTEQQEVSAIETNEVAEESAIVESTDSPEPPVQQTHIKTRRKGR